MGRPAVRTELFVGGLQADVDERLLVGAVAELGDIVEVIVQRDPSNGRSRGFAFVAIMTPTPIELETLPSVAVAGRPAHVCLWPGKRPMPPPSNTLAKGRATPAQDLRALPTSTAASWVEMRGPSGSAVGALVAFDNDESKKIVQRFAELDLRGEQWDGGRLGDAIADQLASAASVVSAGLQAGQVFQVVGLPHLVEGLRTGTYALMQTAEGSLGTVVSSSGGQIAGQLRFAQASMAPVLAPVLAWQVLHGIAGTQQLRQINRRLDLMQRAFENLQARQEAGVLGEVRWAVNALRDILEERRQTGAFTSEMQTRLAQVEKTIGSVLERNRVLVERFGAKAASAHAAGGKLGAVRASTLLREEGSQAVHDMELMAGLITADLQLEEARLYVAMESNPRDVHRRVERVTQKIEEYREVLRELPSVRGLERHAHACIEEMGWWDRNVWSRGVEKEVAALAALKLEDVRPEHLPSARSPSGYAFWRDDTGKTHVRALLPEDREE